MPACIRYCLPLYSRFRTILFVFGMISLPIRVNGGVKISMPLTNSLISHDSSWTDHFADEAARLRHIFLERLVSIHHVGSTCIPTIVAKPEIDILVVLDEIESIDQYSPAMLRLGYEVRGEPDDSGHFYFSKNTEGIRTHKVHVCPAGHQAIWEMLIFKAYLLKNPARAERYESLKVALQEANQEGMREYLDGKAPFIRETLELALADEYEKPRS